MKIQRIAFRWLALMAMTATLVSCGRPEFVGADGEAFDWQDFRGQRLIVNFWAEWCAPCLEEIPELNRLHDAAGQHVLGVNFDRPALPELQRQIRALDVRFPVVYTETQQRLADLTPQVLPTTYVFDQNGQLVDKLVGPQTQQTITATFSKKAEKHN